MKVFLLLISICLYSNVHASDSICRKREGTEIHNLKIDKNNSLVLCGYKEKDYLRDFKAIHLSKNTRKVIFQDDSDNKKYKVVKLKKGFELDEAIDGRYSSPFIKITINCEKLKCIVKDIACIKKNHHITEKLIERLAKAVGNEDQFDNLDTYVEEAFYLALMGNKKARELIKNEFNGLSMMRTEVAMTYRAMEEDIKRLEKLNCW